MKRADFSVGTHFTLTALILAVLLALNVPVLTSCGAAGEAGPGTGTVYNSKNGGGIVIVVDPGHGGNDNGTMGSSGGETFYEKDLNLKTATYLWEALSGYSGVKVYMTRYGDTKLSMEEIKEDTV